MSNENSEKTNQANKDPDEMNFSKNEVIYFGEMVAHENIPETDVAVYFNSVFPNQ